VQDLAAKLVQVEREQLELERRTDNYQLNQMLALGAAAFALLLAAVAVAVAVINSNSNARVISSPASATSAASTPVSSQLSGVPYYGGRLIVDYVNGGWLWGPDGKMHDAYMYTNFVVKPGEKVTLIMHNADTGPHTMTSPPLHLNLTFKPGVDKYTFVIPHKRGTFRWYCTVPCDTGAGGWAMMSDGNGPDRAGYMAGYFTVV
jgi:heme/copper-type cytochrome/quinol oxidase subunit 2